MAQTLTDLIKVNDYTSEYEVCPGCENHCTVKLFHFQNGNTFFSGNNCEKIYSNLSETDYKGVNMFVEKNNRKTAKFQSVFQEDSECMRIFLSGKNFFLPAE